MSLKKLRLVKDVSQEQLAETTGISLRTIQRAESGETISKASKRALADYFGITVESLEGTLRIKRDEGGSSSETIASSVNLHRAAQLIVFVVTFFVCLSQWLAFYAQLSPGTSDANLWTILSYVTQIALGAAVFAYLFNHTKVSTDF